MIGKGNSLRKPRHFWEMTTDAKAWSATWTCRWVGGERKKEAMRRKRTVGGAIEVSGEEKTKRTDSFFFCLGFGFGARTNIEKSAKI
ncbi:hypothetical protein TB2_023780 [Malus domestica]